LGIIFLETVASEGGPEDRGECPADRVAEVCAETSSTRVRYVVALDFDITPGDTDGEVFETMVGGIGFVWRGL